MKKQMLKTIAGVALISAIGHGQAPATQPAPVPPSPAELTVPAGFKASVFASDLQGARLMAVSPEGVLLVAQLLGADQEDALGGEERLDPVEKAAMLGFHQLVYARGHRGQGGGGREPVGARGLIAGTDVPFQHRHAHHEEFVQIRAEDGQELEALEEGHRGILRLLEHAPVELEPGQLAVDEGARPDLMRHGRSRGAGDRPARRASRPRV